MGGRRTAFPRAGPLLMCGMSMAATASPVPDPLVALMSLPTGLVTVAIVHANNTRDIAADRCVGRSPPPPAAD